MKPVTIIGMLNAFSCQIEYAQLEYIYLLNKAFTQLNALSVRHKAKSNSCATNAADWDVRTKSSAMKQPEGAE